MKKIKLLLAICLACFWAAGAAFSASPAVLRTGDLLNIIVQGEPELSGDRVIDSNGSISLPLIGSVGVAGMRAAEAAQLIKQHLVDGFLKNPVVKVTVKPFSTNDRKSPISYSMSESDKVYVTTDSLFSPSAKANEKEEAVPQEEQILIEIKDMVSGVGIPNAILSVDSKIYQTNRLGQMLVSRSMGQAVIIAEGYKTLTGSFNGLIKKGKLSSPSFIGLSKIDIYETIIGYVVDGKTKKPIKSAEVRLDGGKVLTNNRGEFKISGIKKEFGEVVIKKRGYKELKRIVDYKISSQITFELSK